MAASEDHLEWLQNKKSVIRNTFKFMQYHITNVSGGRVSYKKKLKMKRLIGANINQQKIADRNSCWSQ